MASDAAALAPGTLLLAAPVLQDPNFRRTVVLLCEHNPNGTFGLTLNRPLDATLSDVIEGFFVNDPTIYLGGPVQRDTLHYVHRRAEAIPDGIPLTDTVHWGGDFEAVQAEIQRDDAATEDLRFFLGYAGWSPGQLASELEEHAWVVVPEAADLIFETPPDRLWSAAMRRKGGEHALWANFPDNPRMN
ncbi:YqgE/AlgH family protein [Salisaeta longa]|uniref:YqgE/AlgH family protein n=1 Tax=Salisaeta longa TaxID=503170 RepID=UPI0003B39B7C|nr:YqgE/AlgH family protein [Salisaeta longa]